MDLSGTHGTNANKVQVTVERRNAKTVERMQLIEKSASKITNNTSANMYVHMWMYIYIMYKLTRAQK